MNNTFILVVAAQEDVRDILQQALSMAGYQCVVAANGVEALSELEKYPIGVVITDVRLTLMDGLMLTARIRERHDADVIVMAGFTDGCTLEEIIENGASELFLKPVNISELYMRVRRVLRERTLILERNAAMQKLREREQHYQELSITDGLTNILNSRQFYNNLRTEAERSKRYTHPLTVLMLDIDDFKRYNDTYGHLEGDKVLVRFAGIMKSCLRQSDTAYRYGGEEFAIILPVTTGVQGVAAADRIRTCLQEEIFEPCRGTNVRVAVSIGVAEYILGEDVIDFLRRADQNLYEAKTAGKDRVYFTDGNQQKMQNQVL